MVFVTRLIQSVDWFNDVIGKSVAWLTIVMMLVTCVVVAARYLFNMGSIALQESVMYMHGMVFMLGIAFTLKQGGHVRVDIIYAKCQPRTKACIDLAGTILFLLPFSVFVFMASLGYVNMSVALGESSAQPGGLPGVFLLKGMIPAMALLLFLQGLAEAGRALISIVSPVADD